ncbi:TPA: DUF4014 family protein [Salmonella enterica subsp. enterica serovar Saintpaul]
MIVKCLKDCEGWWTEGESYPANVVAGGFIQLAGVQAEKIAEWYSSIVWGPFNKLHNKLNPYRED